MTMNRNTRTKKNIFRYINTDKHHDITGRNLLVSSLFQVLYERSGIPDTLAVICTKEGLVTASISAGQINSFCGYSISTDLLTGYDPDFCIFNSHLDYIMVTSSDPNARDTMGGLYEDLHRILTIIEKDESSCRYLLDCFDSVNNAISIYDSDARLLYANSSFCNDLYIKDRDSAIGCDINEINAANGVKIHSMEDNSSRLKMMYVLEKGREAIDWEVRIESADTPDKYRLLSNDMYPVRDDRGRVCGMVELTHSRKQDIKRTRKIMGLAAEYTFDDIIGSSPVIRDCIRSAREYALSRYTLLLTGESGVGKELFAQSVHNFSQRRSGPFVALNCANFSDGLIESELFGYVGGAFTGASKTGQIGKFELADGGTLFLDEIGELPLHFQSKLLRVLETWMITRIGSSKQIPVDVRIIAATNRNLSEMVQQGLFREDLYYRLQVLAVEIPPLRDRADDILLLSDSFLRQASRYDDECKTLDDRAKELLVSYKWPGNVRELKNVINRATILSKSSIIDGDVISRSISARGYMLETPSPGTPEERMQKKMDEIRQSYVDMLREALTITGGNKKEAAKLAGVSRKTFYRMLENV